MDRLADIPSLMLPSLGGFDRDRTWSLSRRQRTHLVDVGDGSVVLLPLSILKLHPSRFALRTKPRSFSETSMVTDT